MSVFWASAITTDQQGREFALPIGARKNFVISFQGSREQFMQVAKASNLGTPGVRYQVIEVSDNLPGVQVLAVELYLGDWQPGVVQPQLSAQHVGGGQPFGLPHGQVGQDRPAGPIESGGFQTLGDGDLGAAQEAVYGQVDDGTVSDIVQEGGGAREIPRNF